RRDDGTLAGCLYCGAQELSRRAQVRWGPIVLLAILGLAPAYWTFGLTALLVAYPIWFLWSSAPRVETCRHCGSEFVNFCEGPRP
ncbi:MAG: hypothetical protein VXZ39_03395, partial [Planctomycetota bacterium]|nr:hypothetical protein [Planctomycetota bacterium]